MSKITIDNGWLLDQDLDKARVIEQEDARVFRATAIAAYLDREFESASLPAMSPCTVQDEEGKIIGFADVYEKNRKIVVEMVIDNATPERLTAEMREGVRHYARLRGIVHRRSRGDGLIEFTSVQYSVIVEAVVLSTEKPSDPRVAAVGEPLLI